MSVLGKKCQYQVNLVESVNVSIEYKSICSTQSMLTV